MLQHSLIVSERVQQNQSNKKRIKLIFALVDQHSFSVLSEWDNEMNSFLRKESIRFDDRKYFFPLSKYKEIETKIKQMKHLDLKIEDAIPDFVPDMLSHFRRLNENNEIINLYERIETSTVDKLHDYQKEGIKFAIRLNGRCYFADEMGLGKSVQSLCAMKWFQEDWPLLIICTKSLVPKWKDDIKQWLPGLNDRDVFIPKNTKQILERAQITIMSYNTLTYYEDQLNIDCMYRSMIADECHNVKEITSKRTKTCLNLTQKFMKHVILLSGTPVLNRPRELWSQFAMVYENFPKWPQFANRYCDPQIKKIRGKGGAIINHTTYDGSTNIDELNLLIKNTFMIQRTKNEKLELPKKTRELSALIVDLNSIDKEIMEDYDKNFQNSNIVTDQQEKGPGRDIMRWFQDTAKVKAPAVVKRLEELIASKLKMIIFFHHQIMMNAILEMLNRTKTSHIIINGQTSLANREQAVLQFQQKENIRVALLSLKACNTGLNLTAANIVVFAELFWTPSELHQAEARIHRIGQTQPCRCIYLFAKNTVDERIYQTLITKLNVISQAGLKTDENFDRLFGSPHRQSTLDDYFSKKEPKKMNDDIDLFEDDLDDLLRDIDV